ncbi:response regulator [Paenibacillus sp. UNC451MF]|uniref:response regulator n=1 Tax=Paenibacillus sp. UNC451MF TaxID=1449063 RepID=UPI00049138C6|nr:response regulator [Paenibacillus sp. UNC451MF]
MKAMLVDDERLALMQLDKLLKEIPGIEIIGTYLEPSQAIEAVGTLQPDVVFLDIHMPEIYGLKAAELMQEACPSVEIVFVTAYDEYAVQAFELNALDYVMKPIQRERLVRTVQRLQQSLVDNPKQAVQSSSLLIRCLQTMQIELPGNEPVTLKWRTAKAQELFAFLLHHRGQLVRKGDLFEMLWPDFPLEKATTHLYTTIYQVRQDLKRMGADIEIRSLSIKEGYVLDASRVRIDVEEWEQALRRLGVVTADNLHEQQQLVDRYSGDYLADCDYLWAENERQRLRTLWLQQVLLLGDYYTRQGMISEAMRVYHRMQQQYPYYEESYFALMQLYSILNERTAVEEQYKQLTSIMQELDVLPNEKIVIWYEQWKGFGASLARPAQ